MLSVNDTHCKQCLFPGTACFKNTEPVLSLGCVSTPMCLLLYCWYRVACKHFRWDGSCCCGYPNRLIIQGLWEQCCLNMATFALTQRQIESEWLLNYTGRLLLVTCGRDSLSVTWTLVITLSYLQGRRGIEVEGTFYLMCSGCHPSPGRRTCDDIIKTLSRNQRGALVFSLVWT